MSDVTFLLAGQPAPDFAAPQDRGGVFRLAEHRGEWVLLFFFPRANTSYCQMQARRFQALQPQYRRLGVRVVGVSSDTAQQQTVFRDSCQLDFPLITDSEHRVGAQYGVMETERVEGEANLRARRESFLIGPQGRVARHYTEVDANTHAAAVLADLQGLIAVD
ncbi:peroxiredoxin [Deinococcus sp.]|uniref:peroxiredoxin n=1 Tax=Deinococcus sp. TaxID=47478 RepID=UPI003C7D64CF